MMEKLVTKIGGIAGFGVISICLFFVVFTVALIWAFCQKKSLLAEMEQLPLHEEESGTDPKGEDYHV